jgi:hypothetical protein
MPASRLVQFKNTGKDIPKATGLVTGMPRSGKTALAYYLARHIVGGNDVFVMDWPEEEGTATLSDCDAPYATITTTALLDELYALLTKEVKPKGIVWDGLGSSYWMFMKEKVPSGIPPEDHGKTWMAMATELRRQIVRFKMIPGVECFIATSLVWPDKDEITQQEGRLQVVLPGQLKSNIYGLFSYNMNIQVTDGPQGASRVLELQPTARTVAGVRAPLSRPVKARVGYDLVNPKMGVSLIAKELGLISKEEENGTTAGERSGSGTASASAVEPRRDAHWEEQSVDGNDGEYGFSAWDTNAVEGDDDRFRESADWDSEEWEGARRADEGW